MKRSRGHGSSTTPRSVGTIRLPRLVCVAAVVVLCTERMCVAFVAPPRSPCRVVPPPLTAAAAAAAVAANVMSAPVSALQDEVSAATATTRTTKHKYATPFLTRLPRLGQYGELNHDILTRGEEFRLGRKIQRANWLVAQLIPLLEQKKSEQLATERQEEDNDDDIDRDLLATYGFESRPDDLMIWDGEDGDDNDEVFRKLHVDLQARSSNQRNKVSNDAGNADVLTALHLLSDDEVQQAVQIGKKVVQSALRQGMLARQTLIRHNLRLVWDIAAKWARVAAGGASMTTAQVYQGGWSRPSLDDAINEGVIGLAKAAQRYQPQRGLRFSTYATFWIKQYVRLCFMRHMTGPLRIPDRFHEYMPRIKTARRAYYDSHGEMPSLEQTAALVNMRPERVRGIMSVTRSLTSLDAPLHDTMNGFAGGQPAAVPESSETMSMRLVDDSLSHEERIEQSLLREKLENAMSTELAPYERDLLRLRLGLDDGVPRTFVQVAKDVGGDLTAAGVAAVERRALAKLRSPESLSHYQFQSYFDFAGVDEDTVSI